MTAPRLIPAALLATPLALAAPARAEDVAALLARAPAIALDGPVSPLTAPAEVATAGWGPFRRLCVAEVMLRHPDGAEFAATPPYCFTVEDARPDAGLWHVTLRTAPSWRGGDITLTIARDAMGRFGEIAIAMPEDEPPVPVTQFAVLHALMLARLRAQGLERTTIEPRAPFVVPLPFGAVEPGMRVDGDGFACDAEGEARLRGRRVILAACEARAEGPAARDQSLRLTLAGRFAIDVETGMVLQHGYASSLVMQADPRGDVAPREMRGASRQSLE